MFAAAVRVLLAYVPVALVVETFVSGAATAAATIVLTALYVLMLLAQWWPGFLVASVASLLVIPHLAAPYLGTWSVLLALPILPAVFRGLRGVASPLLLGHLPVRPGLSPLASALLAALIMLLLFSLVVSARVLALTSALLAGALLLAALSGYLKLGSAPLEVEPREISVRAGEPVEIESALRPARSQARGLVALAAGSQASIRWPGPLQLERVMQPVVSIVPLLGGPSEVVLQARVTDRLGLFHVAQRLTVARLNVIPRARIATLAAEEYLSHRGSGRDWSGALSGEMGHFLASQGGVEYESSRMYVPGDTLESIDWKHTARLRSLVVKVFDDGARPPGVLLVNLTVPGANEADRLVYEFLSAALTIASASHGAALALYGGRKDSARLSPALWGDGLVRAALDACADVLLAPRAWRRFLRPVAVQEVQRQLARAQQVKSEPAARTVALLSLKEQAMRRQVEAQSPVRLLRESLRRLQPSWCVAFSTMRSDAEAVLTALYDVHLQGVRTRLIDVASRPRGEQSSLRYSRRHASQPPVPPKGARVVK